MLSSCPSNVFTSLRNTLKKEGRGREREGEGGREGGRGREGEREKFVY